MERSREIQNLTKLNTEDFQYVETLHDLVGNRGFGEGYNRPGESDVHYIWEALSAIGEGIGTTIYSNVLHYTDLVANVDTCKVKQLQSFLDLFGMNMSVYDQSNQLPVEIQSLVDTMSINRKYLFRSSLITDELRDRIEKYRNEEDGLGVISHKEDASSAQWYYQNIPNSFYVSRTSDSLVSSKKTDCGLIYGRYTLAHDDGYGIGDVTNRSVKLGGDFVLRVYQNEQGTSILKMCDDSGDCYYALSTGGMLVGKIHDEAQFEDQVNPGHPCAEFTLNFIDGLSGIESDDEFVRQNLDNCISVTYVQNGSLSVDDMIYSDEQYWCFVRDIFLDTLSHFICLPYNTGITVNGQELSAKPIYSYDNFWREYHNSDDKYEYAVDGQFSEQKKVYGIDLSFDERGIVDDIENGKDAIANYSANEQTILSAEMERRRGTLNLTELGLAADAVVADADRNAVSYEQQTRYSYYRYKKVREYIDFVETYMFSSTVAGIDKEYSYDSNYIIANSSRRDTTILSSDGDGVFLVPGYVQSAAEQLANVVQYICKLREVLKIQVRKNYMKGTSNLLRYVVNEYVQDFGKNCGRLKSPSLQSVYDSLVAHDVDDVEVIEYVDTTEYFNIETENTQKSITKSIYNPDYFTEYFKYDKNSEKVVQTKDPYELDIGEIRSFYLSSLALNDILDSNDELNDYLSVIYGIGKSKRYIDSDLSIMVCDLVDGRNSKDMYLRGEFSARCLDQLKTYLGASDYEFKDEQISSQVRDILSSVIFPGLSDTYLSDYSEIYDKYIDGVTEQQDAMNDLKAGINKMLSGDLKYYYAKSLIKYCYSDNDVFSGTYKHDYLYGNPTYDTPYVLGTIQNIQSYSTQTNIQNHPIRDSIDYFKPLFEEMYDDYTDSIKPYLVSLGYTEKSLTNFGELLAAAKTYAQTKKDSLTTEATNKWNTFASTASSLKTQLGAQVQTVNDVVKTLDSTELTKGELNLFSFDKISTPIEEVTWDLTELADGLGDPTHYCKRKESNPDKTDNTEFITTCVYNGKTYYYYYRTDEWEDKGDGRYPYWTQSFGNYAATDQIETRIDVLTKYVSCYRMCRLNWDKDTKTASYVGNSATNVGETTALEQAGAQIDKIQSQYDSITRQMVELGCDDYNDGEATGIEAQVDALVGYINTNSSSKIINASSDIQRLAQVIQTLDTYSQEFETIEDDYNDMVQDSDIASYLRGAKLGEHVSINMLDNLELYSQQKDQENFASIQLSVEEFKSEYDTLASNIRELGYLIRNDIKSANVDDDYVENQLSALLFVLENDRDTKYAEGMEIVTQKKSDATDDFDQMNYVLSDHVDRTDPLSAVLQEIINDNDIDANAEYLAALHEFKTYSNTDGAYQRYYNRKNITHASRQVHPFMWNFIRYVEDSNNTDKIFYSYKVSELESAKVQQTIDNILGENGNLRNIWRYSIQDFSGYTTRYIANDNTTRNSTKIFEVAEYDGAFYPPAIEQYRNDPETCINSLSSQTTVQTICNRINRVGHIATQLSDYLSACTVDTIGEFLYDMLLSCFDPYVYDNNLSQVMSDFASQIDVITISDDITGEEKTITSAKRQDLIDFIGDNLNKTFYERFYEDIGLNTDTIDFIVEQLQDETIRKRIYEITDDQSKANVYDIYDYALDNSNNIYVLYKNYGNAHPTYKQKKNALGQVWVRLENHPIAFPLVSESRDGQGLSQIKFNRETNKYLHDYVYDHGITRNYCYHLEFTQNKKILAMVCKKTSGEMERDVDPVFDKYEYATIVMSQVGSENDERRNIKRLTLTNNNGQFDDIITGLNKKKFELPASKGETTDVYSFLGMYSPSGSRMNLVYVAQKCQNEGDDRVRFHIEGKYPDLKIQKFSTSTQGLDDGTSGAVKSGSWTNGRGRIGDIIFSYNKNENNLTFCFIRDMDGDYRTQDVFDRALDMKSGTQGAIFRDKFTKTMNSFDIFVQNVCTMVTTSPGNTLKMIKYVENNINADMSFIPVYPDRNYSSVIKNDMKEYGCYNIELLGRERNIDKYISNTNPNPNPYFDSGDIGENEKFGRVYEDYLEEYDKTFTTFENVSLNSNMEGYCRIDGTGYEWTVDLKNIDDGAVDDFKILIFNKNTLGKSPYYFGDLTALTSERLADYKSALNDGGSNERRLSDDTTKEGCEFVVTGTNPVNGMTSGIDDNTIYNISSIRFRFDRANRRITTTFKKEDPSIDSSVNQGTVRYVLFNTRDITVFEYYHLFDQYGLINVRYGDVQRVFSGHGEYGGYRFVYDTSKYSKEQLEGCLLAYYQENMRKRNLEDVQLSDYDCLSDVYVFQNHDRLQFKYSDQDVFHISSLSYYFPTLNTKYPYTTGQLVEQHANTIGGTSGDDDSIYDIFDDSDVYIIGFQENNDIYKDIGNVDIPRLYNPNDFVLGFEDYLDTQADLRPDYYNAESLHYLLFSTSSNLDERRSADGIDPQTDLGVQVKGRTSEQVLDDLSRLWNGAGLVAMSAESSPVGKSTRYDRVNLSEVDQNGNPKIEIDGLDELYVNYKRDEDLNGITLYFNYNNYLNSPFIKMDEYGRVLIDTIDSTYLKLKSGESGYLDVMIQVKHREDNVVLGYTNVTLARYQIFNISDDKPKFIVRMLSKVEKDSYTVDDSLAKTCNVTVNDIVVTQDQMIEYATSKFQTDIVVGLNSEDSTIKRSDFYLFFPSDVFTLDTSRSPQKCSATQIVEGCVRVTSDVGALCVKIPIVTVANAYDLIARDTNIYEMFVDEVHVYDKDDHSLFVNIENGVFRVVGAEQKVNEVLEKEQEQYVIVEETGRKGILTKGE